MTQRTSHQVASRWMFISYSDVRRLFLLLDKGKERVGNVPGSGVFGIFCYFGPVRIWFLRFQHILEGLHAGLLVSLIEWRLLPPPGLEGHSFPCRCRTCVLRLMLPLCTKMYMSVSNEMCRNTDEMNVKPGQKAPSGSVFRVFVVGVCWSVRFSSGKGNERRHNIFNSCISKTLLSCLSCRVSVAFNEAL